MGDEWLKNLNIEDVGKEAELTTIRDRLERDRLDRGEKSEKQKENVINSAKGSARDFSFDMTRRGKRILGLEWRRKKIKEIMRKLAINWTERRFLEFCGYNLLYELKHGTLAI